MNSGAQGSLSRSIERAETIDLARWQSNARVMVSLRLIQQPDCRTYPCKEECCSWGVDVYPHERQRMLDDGIATEAAFTGPELDDGDLLYRTAIVGRGCVFLQPDRGCRLHAIGYKPSVCIAVPRDEEEVEDMLADDQMPCHREWKWETSA